MMTYDPLLMTAARRVECEQDGLYFARYFFKQRTGAKMIVNAHHKVMQSVLDRSMLPASHPDFISRLIVTVPPGYTKTEMCVINYIARGLALKHDARFLHLSYSNDLALLNSNTARSLIKSKSYQDMWGLSIKDDTDSKTLWHTEQGGGVKAGAAGGQVTGFRAGHMRTDSFSGALLIDDPLKPDDANSDVLRESVNRNFSETIASRLAVETVPIIVVMQRIHYNDLVGYLLRGGSGERWHHLNLPVLIDNSLAYPDDYTHGIPIGHGLCDGWLWRYKHNETHEQALRAHRRKWQAQYMQAPVKRDQISPLWADKTIERARAARHTADATRTIVAVDPATSDTQDSDEHGIIVASKHNKDQYSVLADYSKRGSPADWAKAAINAYEQHNAYAIVIEINQGGEMCVSVLRNTGFRGKIIKVSAKKGKALRAEPVAALYELGYVAHCAGLSKLEDQMLDFDQNTQKSNSKSPDRMDALVYALTELAGVGDAKPSVRAL